MAGSPPRLLEVASPGPAQPIPCNSAYTATTDPSPFRYIRVEKPVRPQPQPQLQLQLSSPAHQHPHPPPPPFPAEYRARPHGFRIPDWFKPWLGIASWGVTSVAFLLAIAFWKNEVFTGLDHLALYLQSLRYLGHAILFVLIFITTIPPFPLYSTLIILSGYTFGTWTGAAISYSAALSGATVVFLLARHYLRASMSRLLKHTLALQRVVRAIERRPNLLLLIRIAPYPYNLMNVLLAASHTLSFRTYFFCTALSLVKVVIHTSLGASMHSFAAPDPDDDPDSAPDPDDDGSEHAVARAWTVAGVILSIALLLYLSWVARRAVDDELEADPHNLDAEERAASEMREVMAPTQ